MLKSKFSWKWGGSAPPPIFQSGVVRERGSSPLCPPLFFCLCYMYLMRICWIYRMVMLKSWRRPKSPWMTAWHVVVALHQQRVCLLLSRVWQKCTKYWMRNRRYSVHVWLWKSTSPCVHAQGTSIGSVGHLSWKLPLSDKFWVISYYLGLKTLWPCMNS